MQLPAHAPPEVPELASFATVRRMPMRGEIGCPGACPLCTVEGKTNPPCLACREEMRARLAEMQMPQYLARAVN